MIPADLETLGNLFWKYICAHNWEDSHERKFTMAELLHKISDDQLIADGCAFYGSLAVKKCPGLCQRIGCPITWVRGQDEEYPKVCATCQYWKWVNDIH